MTEIYRQRYVEHESRYDRVISVEASGKYIRGSDGSGWIPTISSSGANVTCGRMNVHGATSLPESDTCVYTAILSNGYGERYTWTHIGIWDGTINATDIRDVHYEWE